MPKLKEPTYKFKSIFEPGLIVYVSGPMSDMPNKNHEAFNDATKQIRALKFTVFNPAENDGGSTHKSWSWYMNLDVISVAQAHILVLLPGWEHSEGATFEVLEAERLEKKIYLIDEFVASIKEKREPKSIKPRVKYKVTLEEETILEEAERIVFGSRQRAYDHPMDNFTRIGKIWEGIKFPGFTRDEEDHMFHFPGLEDKIKKLLSFTPEDVAMMMVGVKLGREAYKPTRDNKVDIIGYTIALDRIHRRRAGLE
jgi:hypothetical protein